MQEKHILIRRSVFSFLLMFMVVWTVQPLSAQAVETSPLVNPQGKPHNSFGNAYFFGDSLTDCCWIQRFTNNNTPNWADLLPEKIGASFTAGPYTNFAVASAQSGYGSTSPVLPTVVGEPLGFLAQVDRFGEQNIAVKANDIAGIWIGSNDIWPSSYAEVDQPPDVVGEFNRSFGIQPDVTDLTNYIINNIRSGINELVAYGFRHIVLLSPYDLGQSALVPNAAAAMLATQYSTALRDAMARLYTPGVKTYFVDVLSLLQKVQTKPHVYGFKHTTAVDNCLENGCENLSLKQQNTYIFYDIFHLTNGFYKVLVKEAARIIKSGKTIPAPGPR